MENKNEKDNGKYKIICIKAPKWLRFILKKIFGGKKHNEDE